MAHVKIKGINKVSKRLADGSIRIYYYHRSTGAPLPGSPGSPEFLTAYTEAETTTPRDTGTVAALIRMYLLSPKFESKAPSTQREYRRIATDLESCFGTMPIKALASPKVRGVFLTYQEDIGRDRPREADNRLSVLSAIFTYAARKGEIADNPLRGFERLYHADRSDFVWTEADILKFMETAPAELQ
jgi:hypothetical protein